MILKRPLEQLPISTISFLTLAGRQGNQSFQVQTRLELISGPLLTDIELTIMERLEIDTYHLMSQTLATTKRPSKIKSTKQST